MQIELGVFMWAGHRTRKPAVGVGCILMSSLILTSMSPIDSSQLYLLNVSQKYLLVSVFIPTTAIPFRPSSSLVCSLQNVFPYFLCCQLLETPMRRPCSVTELTMPLLSWGSAEESQPPQQQFSAPSTHQSPLLEKQMNNNIARIHPVQLNQDLLYWDWTFYLFKAP